MSINGDNVTRGVVHIHSSYSRDGDMAIPELKDFCCAAGLSFACLTDHAEDLSGGDVEHLTRECDEVSDENFSMIPGLEIVLNRHTHVLAFGLRSKPESREPVDVLREIKQAGAVVVIAHPLLLGKHVDPEVIRLVDGIEVWNGGHDGGFFPDPAVLGLFNSVTGRLPHVMGFGGDDLHRRDEKVRVRTVLPGKVFGSRITDALSSGKYLIQGKLWKLGSRPVTSFRSLAALKTSYGAYLSARRVRDYFGQKLGTEG